MSLGERISQLREQNQLSQYQLSKLMEVSRQAVSKWETDQSSPDAKNLIRLADILDTDIEYLTTGRRTYGRRPPVVIKTVETVEKIVEKPVYIDKPVYIEKIVENVVETPVIQYVEKPVVKKVTKIKYRRNPIEFFICGVVCFLFGLLIGFLC